MSIHALPTIDVELPGLLRRLHAQCTAADRAGQQATMRAIGAARSTTPTTLVGALCIGGSMLAERLVEDQHPDLDAQARKAVVLDAFFALLDVPAQADPGHERQLARQLIEGFGLQAEPQALLDIVRAGILIDEAPLLEVPEAVLAAMRHAQWDLALRGLQRMRDGLADETPRNAYGLAAMCLHRLGRYDEIDAWLHEGLGAQAALLAIPPVFSEDELLRRWGRHTTPVVSIICPTYNHERYVESAIRGFLSQDCPVPFEILIHDDASTDRTADVIRRWQAQYPKIIKPLLQTENQFSRGVRPFELMLARARGAFVATCEGDDYWTDPAKLWRQVDFLQRHRDFSCSAHNYLHFHESALTVRPWSNLGRDFVLGQRQLMRVQLVLWLPTLVFRKTFSTLPAERDLAAIGDQFLTSYLGTQGRCMYFETQLGAVRRENEFSIWSPLPKVEKERRRIKTWAALARMHARLGQRDAVSDLMARIAASTLDEADKAAILDAAAGPLQPALAAA